MDIAYLAGIVDGEGSICLSKVNGGKSFSPNLSVDSTDHELLAWIKERYAGHITNKSPATERHRQAWTWRIKGKAALALLDALLPYMVIERKRRRAQALTEGYRQVITPNGYYTDEQRQARSEFYTYFRSL